MGKLNCGQAQIEEIPSRNPAFERYAPDRKRVAEESQAAVYLDFMTRAELDRLQANDFKSTWAESYRRPVHLFNATVGNEVVGVADLRTQTAARDGYALVEPIYVIKACWQHGVGRKLWEACAAAAHTEGAPGMQVVSLDGNTRGRRFYERTLKLTKLHAESVTIGDRVFPATRYEVPNW
ncbi:MAG TPA: GNAT family N-acetyltransferase [Candidatus Acidoferrum sp.]|nr:GNAT family N-acetyltransferase [Candidatus Acidoferrum sp.]